MKLAFAFVCLTWARVGRAEPLTGIFDGARPALSLKALLGDGEAVAAVDNGPSESERRQVRINQELIAEARRGNVDDVRALLRQGAYVNAKDENGDSPLIWACSRGHIEVARELLTSGAHVNSRNDLGRTALYFAAEAGNVEMVRLLIGQRGINLNLADRYGTSPWARARQRSRDTNVNQHWLDVIAALRAAGATEPPDPPSYPDD